MAGHPRSTLIVIEDGSFTYDNRVIREANALLEEGWDVTVICPKNREDPFYKRESDRLRIYFYPKPEARSTIGHVIEHSTSILAVSLLSWVAYLRHGFRIVQGCNPMDILWIPYLPFRIFGVRYVFDHHDLCPELYLCRGEGSRTSVFFRILLWLEHQTFRFANTVIATNESYRAIAIERGGRHPDDVFVVRNGPDLAKFRPVPPRLDLTSNGDILIGYLGNMNPQDGVDYLLLVAKELTTNRGVRNLRFVLVGGGSHQAELKRQCSELGLDNVVTFTGRLPDDDMLATLCACDICVQPDPSNPLNDRSTMNKVMEYMALGKPVVAFDLTETRVSCGDAALYAEPNNVSGLADMILKLATDAPLRQQMGHLGRKRIEETLAWPYSVPNLLDAYAHALGRQS